MKAKHSRETFETIHPMMQHHVPEGLTPQLHHCEKSETAVCILVA
jgi:hypothetical protein